MSPLPVLVRIIGQTMQTILIHRTEHWLGLQKYYIIHGHSIRDALKKNNKYVVCSGMASVLF